MTNGSTNQRRNVIIVAGVAVVVLLLACCGFGAVFADGDSDSAGRQTRSAATGQASSGATTGPTSAPTSASPTATATPASTPAALPTRTRTTVPAAPPTKKTTTRPANCDPSYPTVCIPPAPPDLNCPDVKPLRKFKVLPPDPHGFDGNHDGVGCENN